MSTKIKNFLSSTFGLFNEYKLPLLSGVLQATSYIPFQPWGLCFCLVPLWMFWINSDFKKNIKGTLVCAFVASFIGFHWISIVAHDFGKMPWPVSILVLVAFSLVANIHLVFAGATWGFLKLFTSPRLGLWLIPFTTALFVTFFPALFPWNFGYAWIYANLPGAQLADIMGVVSLSSITLFINFLVLLAVKDSKYLTYGLSAVVLFISINALGLLHLRFIPEEKGSLNVGIVQANIGNLEKQHSLNRYSFRENVVSKYMALSEILLKENPKLDLLVWPETAYPQYVDLKAFETSASVLSQLAKKHKTSLATGFYDLQKNNQVGNAILYVDKKGQLADQPTLKTILLAFGEYLPLSDRFPSIRNWLPMVADFIRGPGPQIRHLEGINYGSLICYESLFPLFSRELANQKANVLLNVTNDSWYDDVFEPNQHLYITAGRALENRRPLIRSTNTGLSTVIRSNGQPMDISPRSQEWAGAYKISYPDKNYQTIYQRWGKNLHHVIIVVSLIGLFVIGRLRKTA